MLVRRNLHIQSNSFCVLWFDWEDETIDHLFFDCPFAKRCWDKLQINWTNDANIHDGIIHNINLAGMPFFMEIFLIAAWELWKIRNTQVFDGIPASLNGWLHNFKEEAQLQSHGIGEADRLLIHLWIDAL